MAELSDEEKEVLIQLARNLLAAQQIGRVLKWFSVVSMPVAAFVYWIYSSIITGHIGPPPNIHDAAHLPPPPPPIFPE